MRNGVLLRHRRNTKNGIIIMDMDITDTMGIMNIVESMAIITMEDVITEDIISNIERIKISALKLRVLAFFVYFRSLL